MNGVQVFFFLVGFFPSILWCSHWLSSTRLIGQVRKESRKSYESYHMLATWWNLLSTYGNFGRQKILKIRGLWCIVFFRKILCMSHTGFLLVTEWRQKKTLKWTSVFKLTTNVSMGVFFFQFLMLPHWWSSTRRFSHVWL